MATCPVCCELYTNYKRAEVGCAYCDYTACAQCYRQYILSNLHDAHCMSCRRTWTRDVLGQYFPPTFLNGEYKRHRERVLIERERAMLPESQGLVWRYRQAEALRKDIEDKTDTLADLKRKHMVLQHEIFRDRRVMLELQANNYRGYGSRGGDSSSSRRQEFVAPCSVEECRGFIATATYACGTCNAKHCKKCGKHAGDNEDTHECLPEDVSSFKTVLQSTRACPKCAVRIFKISGCDQMYVFCFGFLSGHGDERQVILRLAVASSATIPPDLPKSPWPARVWPTCRAPCVPIP